MKALILFIIILIASPAFSAPKEYLPFAKKGKYGKLRTKQAKPVKQKKAWIYRQWKRC